MCAHGSTPDLVGEDAQDVVNNQIVDNCDLLIGIFWTKLGTPTGRSDSGTAEEIERVRSAGKRCLLYFSDKQVQLSQHNPDEYKRLKEYKQKYQSKAGMYGTFCDTEELKEKIDRDLIRALRDIREQEKTTPKSSAASNISSNANNLKIYLKGTLIQNNPTIPIQSSMATTMTESGGAVGIEYLEVQFAINNSSDVNVKFKSLLVVDDYFEDDRKLFCRVLPNRNKDALQNVDYETFYDLDQIISLPDKKVGYQSPNEKVLNPGEWSSILIKMPISSAWYPFSQAKLLNCEMRIFSETDPACYPLIIKALPGNQWTNN